MAKSDIDSYEDLINYIRYNIENIDAIVVEGYDGVGKGRLLNMLSKELSVVPYRPDYNLWQKHDLRGVDRWKISGFFWDVFSHFYEKSEKVLLFDRGVLSGAVYYDDLSIARDYKKLLRGMKVLHVLVVCDKEDYLNLLKVRSKEIKEEDFEDIWLNYCAHEYKYRFALDVSEVDYIVCKNKFSKDLAELLSRTCEGCGHYSYGYCRHPSKNCRISSSDTRCSLSYDKEVQDIDVREMQCL